MLRRWIARMKQRPSDAGIEQASEISQLLAEIEEAKRDWQHAHQKLDHALDTDQIDYAIYAFQAAEKRYSMLIRKMKHLRSDGLINEKGEYDDE